MTPQTDIEFAKSMIRSLELHSMKLSHNGMYMRLTPEMLETKLEVNPPRCAKWECDNLVFGTNYCEECIKAHRSKKAV